MIPYFNPTKLTKNNIKKKLTSQVSAVNQLIISDNKTSELNKLFKIICAIIIHELLFFSIFWK